MDFIVGNPPFLGDKKLRSELGADYIDALFALYSRRVSNQADLCCYWFERARCEIEMGRAKRAGLLATQSIRGGASRRVLERIKASGDIFYAISDREWILEGANVHISLVGFDSGEEPEKVLDERRVSSINPNLTSATDLSRARRLAGQQQAAFIGVSMHGPFDMDDETGLKLLCLGGNPHGRPNSDVVRPILNAYELVRRSDRRWVVAFPVDMPEREAALYEGPFHFTVANVLPVRRTNNRRTYRERWWIHGEARPAMQSALASSATYILTPRVAKHRVFRRADTVVLPSDATVAFAIGDDSLFGILQSRFHELWALGTGTRLETRPRYTPTTCFETFPFPEASAEQKKAISGAVRELDQLREQWLNPDDWVKEEILEFPGSADGPWSRYVQDSDERGLGTVRYPRTVPRDDETAAQLARRTLTHLYNQRPAWLDHAHRRLDEAVATAYGWPADLPDEEILERLLAVNLERE